MNRTKGYSLHELLMVLWFLFILAIVIPFGVFTTASIAVSSFKAIKNECGQTLTLEKYFDGDWFCPSNDVDDYIK